MPPREKVPIYDDDVLWRRLHPDWLQVDPKTGQARITSAAFRDGDNEVCVHLARLTSRESIEASHPNMGTAAIEARIPRSCEHSVEHEPEEGDPSHAVIRPPAGRGVNQIKR